MIFSRLKLIFFKRYNLITEAICTYNFHNALTRNTQLVCTHLCSYETFFLSKKIKHQHINMHSKHQKIFKWRQLETYWCVLYLYMCNFQFSKTDNNFPNKNPHIFISILLLLSLSKGLALFSEYWVFVKACINCLLVIIHVFNTSSHCCPVTRCFENIENDLYRRLSIYNKMYLNITWNYPKLSKVWFVYIYICIVGSNKVEKYLR